MTASAGITGGGTSVQRMSRSSGARIGQPTRAPCERDDQTVAFEDEPLDEGEEPDEPPLDEPVEPVELVDDVPEDDESPDEEVEPPLDESLDLPLDDGFAESDAVLELEPRLSVR